MTELEVKTETVEGKSEPKNWSFRVSYAGVPVYRSEQGAPGSPLLLKEDVVEGMEVFTQVTSSASCGKVVKIDDLWFVDLGDWFGALEYSEEEKTWGIPSFVLKTTTMGEEIQAALAEAKNDKRANAGDEHPD